MSTQPLKTMRDAIIPAVTARMRADSSIYFLTADLGAPSLDQLRLDFPDRFINVGIAEQNLINVGAGLALEGCRVFLFGIAPFVSMRCFEQVRNNLSLLSQTRPVNVNILSVGAGFSYEVSGPTHHALEDLALMRTLPNLELFSPSDSVMAGAFVSYALSHQTPKYWRLDGKPLPVIYPAGHSFDFHKGFEILQRGDRVGLVSTGCLTHGALELCQSIPEWRDRVGLIDLFMLQPMDEAALQEQLCGYTHIVTLEEGFVGKGGLDSLVNRLVIQARHTATVDSLGIPPHYLFEAGSRAFLRQACGMDPAAIHRTVEQYL
ncbi:MAG: transketolase C-terminal domain-containing protein [Kiritimatiellales bacterium]